MPDQTDKPEQQAPGAPDQTTTTGEPQQAPTPPAPNPPPEPEVNPNASVQARVLMSDVIEGVSYSPNTYVQFKAKVAIPLEKAGRIDTSDDAIAYCKSNKLEKIVHEDAKKALNAPKPKNKGRK
ncbi:ETC complex I subunit [Gilvimarinus agarilyticus]|uniref:hypothetical protein n=1 Tax=Gilvimarinus agarilyticus TaxID=679259 RepID=UPI0005A15641|nr:hypothetical protein [Gilvimarinus agarilyticus]